jgi:hypothetical protein
MSIVAWIGRGMAVASGLTGEYRCASPRVTAAAKVA